MSDRVHDRLLLDALEAIEPEPFAGDVWRVARRGRDALRGSVATGRWSPPGAIEVLYTSLERDGALAEVGYRLSLEPVWPSRLAHDLHRITVRTERTLRLADLAVLQALGVDTLRYETFEYTATQAIAAAARFLEFDGLMAPSARAPCTNLVLFLDRLSDSGHLEVRDSQPVDWNAWLRRRR